MGNDVGGASKKEKESTRQAGEPTTTQSGSSCLGKYSSSPRKEIIGGIEGKRKIDKGYAAIPLAFVSY